MDKKKKKKTETGIEIKKISYSKKKKLMKEMLYYI